MIWRKLLQACCSTHRRCARQQRWSARTTRNQPRHVHLAVEALESRCLLSVVPGLAGSDPSSPNSASGQQLAVDVAWFEVLDPAESTVAHDTAGVRGTLGALESVGQSVSGTNRAQEVLPAQWLVQLAPPLAAQVDSPAAAAERLEPQAAGARVVRGLGLRGWLLVAAQPGTDPQRVQSWLESHPMIAHWEVDGTISTDRLPDDADFAHLWGLENLGQSGGTPDADIDAPEIWDVVTGSADVVVAVIDTGLDYTHPDLVTNVWTNPGEIPGNGLDDDGNGFVDDVHGYDFANGDSDPMDDEGHGTHVAGIVAAAGNNGRGVVGVSWTGSIMPLKFLDDQGSGTTSNAVLALNYATLMRTAYGINVRVANASWGGGDFSQALHDAIEAAGAADILFAVAAGNEATNLDQQPQYPPSYDLANIVVVAASDRNDQLAEFSNYGPETVDLAAPGVDIYSTVPGDQYDWLDGTSMATPYVAGTAALLWAAVPNASVAEVRRALLAGADRLPALQGAVADAGRLNAWNALRELGLTIVASDPAQEVVLNEPPVEFSLRFSAPLDSQSIHPDRFLVNDHPANRAMLLGAATIRLQFDQSPVVVQGPQQMRAEAGLVAAANGGDLSGAWQAVFYYDTVPLAVTATVPEESETLSTGPEQLVLHFSEPIDTASIDTSDLELSSGRVSDFQVLDGNTVAYRLADLPREGRIEYRLLPGTVRDRFGNPSAAFDGSFSIDDPRFERLVYAGPVLPIRDFETTSAEISVEQSVIIADLDVMIDAIHSYTADLEAYLVAPSGVRIALLADNGGAGANLSGTIFDDEAPVAISDGEAPFRGRYRPLEPLAVLDGSDLYGTWTLEIHDGSALDEGRLNGWELLVERGPEQAPQVRKVEPIPLTGEVVPPAETLTVHFSKPPDPASVDPALWELRQAGPDRQFHTGDDQLYRLHQANPYTDGVTVELVIEPSPLPAGRYRLLIPSGGVRDRYGIALDGDGDGSPCDDFGTYFEVPTGRWYQAADVPRDITGLHTTVSRLQIEESFTLADVDVLLDITHTYVGDLDIYLVAPNGTRIELATDVGGTGDDFSGTIFDQQAPTSIVDTAAPFTGRFRPEGSLDVLAGIDAQGPWVLEITDDSPWDVGTLNRWALALHAGPPQVLSVGPLPGDPQRGGQPLDEFVVRFSAAIDTLALSDPQNWELRQSGTDGRFGTSDDRLYRLETAASADARSVTLATHSGRLPPGTYRIRASAAGLVDSFGTPLDGDGDGIPGGDFLREFTVRSQVRYVASDVPVTIWDRRTVLSAVYVPDSFPLRDVDIALDITHSFDADLHVWLVAPDGRRVKLFGDVGGSGDGFSGTIFDDDAASGIDEATAPFAGVFRPMEPLGALTGIDARGTWILEITDDANLDSGVLNSWYLVLDGAPLAPPSIVGYSPQGVVPGPVSEMVFDFDEPMDLAGFAPEDDVVSFSGPEGPIAIETFRWLDPHRLQITFAPQSTPGSYRLAVGAQVPSRFGMALDQDGDHVPGEAGDDSFLATFTVPAVLGPIEWQQLDNLDPSAGPLWFRIETTRQGILSVEASAPGSASRLQLELFPGDSLQAPLSSVTQQGTARIDWQAGAAGEVYYVRLNAETNAVRLRMANLLVPREDTITVQGTAADDSFAFLAGNPVRITLNGLQYRFPAEAAAAVVFRGGGGNDSAEWFGSSADENVALSPGRASLQGGGFQLLADRVESIVIAGGGGTDVATMVGDPATASTFLANGSTVQMQGVGFQFQVDGFSQVTARAAGRPDDWAMYYDSPGDDVLRATGQTAVLSGPQSVYRAEGFGRIDAYAIHGGTDTAVLAARAGENLLVATPRYVTLQGDNYHHRVVGFARVDASGSAGAGDVAKFYGSADNDKFIATANYAMLVTPVSTYRVTQFDRVYAYAGAGGGDEAKLYGNHTPGHAVLTPQYVSLKMADRYYQASGFQMARIQAGSGPSSAALYGSPGSDVLTATPVYVRLAGTDFTNSAVGFAQVSVYSVGGNDRAELYDSPNNDLLVSTPAYTTLAGPGYAFRVVGFSTIRAYATAGGRDEARLYDSRGNDQLVALPQYAVLSGDGFVNRVAGFQVVTAVSGAGGNDTARLYDSALVDWLHAETQSVRLRNETIDFEHLVRNFAQVFVWLQNPDDQETVADEVDYLVTYHLW